MCICAGGRQPHRSIQDPEQRSDPRPAARAALALAIAVAGVGELEANTLRVLRQAPGHAPGAIRAAFGPASGGRTYRLLAFAARKRPVLTVRPRGRRRPGDCKVGGPGRANRDQNTAKQQCYSDQQLLHDPDPPNHGLLWTITITPSARQANRVTQLCTVRNFRSRTYCDNDVTNQYLGALSVKEQSGD